LPTALIVEDWSSEEDELVLTRWRSCVPPPRVAARADAKVEEARVHHM